MLVVSTRDSLVWYPETFWIVLVKVKWIAPLPLYTKEQTHQGNNPLVHSFHEGFSQEKQSKTCLWARDGHSVIGLFESSRDVIGQWSLCYKDVILRLTTYSPRPQNYPPLSLELY